MTDVAFLGSTDASAAHLIALLEAGLSCVAVSPPDRRRGRRGVPTPSPVRALALERGVPCHATPSVNRAESLAWLGEQSPQVLVVVAFGQILRDPVLALAPLGPLNVHFSLLPRWRGAAPVRRAILAGDVETGVCVQRMVAALDAGPLVAEARTAIGPEETAPALHERLTALGCPLIVDVVARLLAGERVEAVEQAVEGVTYAKKVERDEGDLDPASEGAAALARRVRAFAADPGCGAAFERPGRAAVPVHVHRARAEPAAVTSSEASAPGDVTAAGDDGIVVATRDGAFRVLDLQRPGKRVLTAREFLNGCSVEPGDRLQRPG